MNSKQTDGYATRTNAPVSRIATAFPLTYFVVLAFAFTWFFWGLQLLAERGVVPALPGLMVMGAFGPMVAAVLLTARKSGRAGLRSLLGRIVRWRVAPIWYGVALLGPILLNLVAIALHVALLGGQPPTLAALVGALPTVLAVSAYMLIFVALGEEIGWRGYALPTLQARHGALVSSVILAVVWALWHLPLFFNPSSPYSGLPFVLWLAFLIPFTILITWVFNSSGGSVLMAMLVHAVMNASGTSLWSALPELSGTLSATEAAAATVRVYLMNTIVLWVAAIGVVFIYGSLNLSRRPRSVMETSERRDA